MAIREPAVEPRQRLVEIEGFLLRKKRIALAVEALVGGDGERAGAEGVVVGPPGKQLVRGRVILDEVGEGVPQDDKGLLLPFKEFAGKQGVDGLGRAEPGVPMVITLPMLWSECWRMYWRATRPPMLWATMLILVFGWNWRTQVTM